jgi:hypothetical protein
MLSYLPHVPGPEIDTWDGEFYTGGLKSSQRT